MSSVSPASDGEMWPALSPAEDDELLEMDRTVQAQEEPSPRFDLESIFWRFIASGTKSTPPDVLRILATDPSKNVRRRAAGNRHTPADALMELARDKHYEVRAAVAENPSTPIHILRMLCQDEEVEVRYAIASNPEMPDAILLSLFLDPDPYVAERASQTLAA